MKENRNKPMCDRCSDSKACLFCGKSCRKFLIAGILFRHRAHKKCFLKEKAAKPDTNFRLV